MRWRSKPFTKIAGIGRTGQTCSHAPQPMHVPLSTTGTPLTRTIALTGHLRWHAVQGTSSVVRRQRSFFQIAWPMWRSRRATWSRSRSAPAGHAAAHFCGQARRQWLRRKSIFGWPNVLSDVEGTRHFSGHAAMHAPQPTHSRLKSARSTAPGGRTSAGRAGTPGRDTGANPPSVVFSTTSAAARRPMPDMSSRRVTPPAASPAFALAGGGAAKHLRQAPHPSFRSIVCG